jgi:hypothetical protein
MNDSMNCIAASRRSFFGWLIAAWAWPKVRKETESEHGVERTQFVASYQYDHLGRLISATYPLPKTEDRKPKTQDPRPKN